MTKPKPRRGVAAKAATVSDTRGQGVTATVEMEGTRGGEHVWNSTVITGTPRAVGQARGLKRPTSTAATAPQPAH